MSLGIIGFPIGHSISPIFQQAALDHLGIDAAYQAWEVTPDALPTFLEGLSSSEFLGVNVTVPHKEAVMAYLDRVDEWARLVGAVNTIHNSGGELVGYNTDGLGFLRALGEAGGFDPTGCRALLLGAGGSARAVVCALAEAGTGSLTIANRTLDRAERLAGLARAQGLKCEAIPIDPAVDVLLAACKEADLIVNCTTLGMLHGPGEGCTPLNKELIPAKSFVYDLVYNPPETPLLREAIQAGASRLGGLHMLVYQGAASFKIWTGKDAPVYKMLCAAKNALS